MTKIFITGTAGFIGFHLAQLLLEQGHHVHGYDGMTDYYDPALKHRRHQMLLQNANFTCTEAMLEDMDALTFGSNVLLRHLTFSEARKMPIKEFHVDRVLEGFEMTMEQVGKGVKSRVGRCKQPSFLTVHRPVHPARLRLLRQDQGRGTQGRHQAGAGARQHREDPGRPGQEEEPSARELGLRGGQEALQGARGHASQGRGAQVGEAR